MAANGNVNAKETEELETLTATTPSFRVLLPLCESVLERGADPFRVQQRRGGPSRSAFERLLCGLQRLKTQRTAATADSLSVSNWPLCEESSFLQKQTFDSQSAAAFPLLVDRFLQRLPNNKNSFSTVAEMFRESLPALKQNLIPSQCFPFVSMLVTKICSLARHLNREKREENEALQAIRDVFPRRLLELLQRTVPVLSQSLAPNQSNSHSHSPSPSQSHRTQTILESGAWLLSLLRETNGMVDSILSIGPLHPATRESESLCSHCDLSALFTLTVRTVFFTAGYGSLLGHWKTRELYTELATLIVQTLSALRTREEMSRFGSEFAQRVRTAISMSQNGRDPRRGSESFFAFIQNLEQAANRPLNRSDLKDEEILNSVPFPTDETLCAAQPQLSAQDSHSLVWYRVARGMPPHLPNLPEQFPSFAPDRVDSQNGKQLVLWDPYRKTEFTLVKFT